MGFRSTDPTFSMPEFFRRTGGCAVVDGGLATQLEAYGADLNDPLWSATCLLTSPELIRKVHLDYLEAGANIIISASYQATIQGFEARGFSKDESEALLRKSVEIACEARGIFQKSSVNDQYSVGSEETYLRQHPILVAASIGSYGAYLANGSEYRGDYGKDVSLETLKDFHRRRLQVLAESCADLIAFETIPNKVEAQTTDKPIIVYPNSGELYDADKKEWVVSTVTSDEDFISYVGQWREAGASLIGGCCRTTPRTIRAVAEVLSSVQPVPEAALT